MKRRVVLIISVLLALTISVNVHAAEKEMWAELVGGVVFIGDSYCLGYNLKDDGKSYPDGGWAQMTVEALSLEDYAISCLGGTGFARKNNGVNFETLLDRSLEKVQNPNTIGWVFAMGGYNDLHESYDDIYNGGISFVERAHELFPNAKVGIAMAGYDSKRPQRQKIIEKTVVPAWRAVAEDTNETYVGIPEIILRDKKNSMSKDGFHPNSTGQYALEQAPEIFLYQKYREAINVWHEEQEKLAMEAKENHRKSTVNTMPSVVGTIVVITGAIIGLRLFIADKQK